jgi:hypothetical protein
MSTPLIALEVLVVAEQYTFYVNYIVFVAGLIGNILNILVFTKLKLFRGNRCAFYLIVESIANIALLSAIVIPQIFQMIYGADPSNLSLIWCKIRTTIGEPWRLLVSSSVCFEAFDQFLSTNHRFVLRQLSTLGLARRLICISCCLWILQTIPYIIFYEIVPPFGCIIVSSGLTHYYSYFYYPILNGSLPILIPSVFGLLAYRNVRRIVRRQIPIERRRLDRQLTAMIFVRVVFFVILLLPYTIFRIYTLNITISPVDSLPYAMNQLIFAIVSSLLTWIYAVRLLCLFSRLIIIIIL